MSVINQMLKDLEQRSPEPNSQATQSGHVAVVHSPIKIALVSGVCVFAICLLSFYVWQLINENNALKAEQITHSANATDINSAKNSSTKNRSEVITSQVNTSKQISSNENKTDKVSKSIAVTKAEHEQKSVSVNGQSTKLSTGPSTEASTELSTELSSEPRKVGKVLSNNRANQVTPAKHAEVIAQAHSQTHSHSGDTSGHSDTVTRTVKAEPKLKSQPKVNKMSVSRRQLSADELAEQKLTLAEKALAAKQVEQAEKLLEEVVIIRPNDSQTRQKLAALWFGRQAYQGAVNLLSQGIALNAKDSSLRQMKARIHLKQGQLAAALNTLKPLAQLKDEQYQIMLANIAQQAQQNKVAVEAYKTLIAMKPDIGRWQLGLAVLYDKNSQFDLASMAYKKALIKNDLSASSENFVKQRIQVIGQ